MVDSVLLSSMVIVFPDKNVYGMGLSELMIIYHGFAYSLAFQLFKQIDNVRIIDQHLQPRNFMRFPILHPAINQFIAETVTLVFRMDYQAAIEGKGHYSRKHQVLHKRIIGKFFK